MDSIPAVLGISKDPFIVYSSNIFAIMGMRYHLCMYVCMYCFYVYIYLLAFVYVCKAVPCMFAYMYAQLLCIDVCMY